VVETVEAPDRLANSQVAGREHVGPLQLEQEEHVGCPFTEALHRRNLPADFFIGQPIEVIDVELARHDVLRKRPQIFRLHAGEPDGLEIGDIHREQLGGRRHPTAEALPKPTGDRTGGVTRDLLPDDPVDEDAEGVANRAGAAPGCEIDRPDGIDQRRQL